MALGVASTCSTFRTPTTYLISPESRPVIGSKSASTVAPGAAKSRRGAEEPFDSAFNGFDDAFNGCGELPAALGGRSTGARSFALSVTSRSDLAAKLTNPGTSRPRQ
jgi:hypothetical protein